MRVLYSYFVWRVPATVFVSILYSSNFSQYQFVNIFLCQNLLYNYVIALSHLRLKELVVASPVQHLGIATIDHGEGRMDWIIKIIVSQDITLCDWGCFSKIQSHIHIRTYMYMCVCVCVCVCLCVCVCVCARTCMRMCVLYVSMYLCIYVWTYVCNFPNIICLPSSITSIYGIWVLYNS